MRRCIHFIIFCFLIIFLVGCEDRLDLEKQSISLIYGFDAKPKGKLIVYHVNPIFNEDVEKKYEIHEAKVHTYLLPLIKEGWLPIINTVKSTIIAFLGFEFSFVLYPYLTNKASAKKGIVIANLITLFIYLQITFVSFIYFSPDGITKFLWPTLSLVTPFHFSFLERFEIIFLSFYLFIIFDSCIPYIFTASDGINQLLNKKGSSLPIYFLLFGCIFILFFYIPSSYQISALREFWGTASYFIVFLFPVVFLLYMTLYQHWKRRKI